MAHAQKPNFVFRRNGWVHLNRRGRHFSRLLAAEICASALVMLDTPRSEAVWEYWLPTPFASFPFTSPPVRHRVPSGFKRTLPRCLLWRRLFCLQFRSAGKEGCENACFWQVSSADSSVVSRCQQSRSNFTSRLIRLPLKIIGRHLFVGHACCRLHISLANSVPSPGWSWTIDPSTVNIVAWPSYEGLAIALHLPPSLGKQIQMNFKEATSTWIRCWTYNNLFLINSLKIISYCLNL
jgi:hypothetical protein